MFLVVFAGALVLLGICVGVLVIMYLGLYELGMEDGNFEALQFREIYVQCEANL